MSKSRNNAPGSSSASPTIRSGGRQSPTCSCIGDGGGAALENELTTALNETRANAVAGATLSEVRAAMNMSYGPG